MQAHRPVSVLVCHVVDGVDLAVGRVRPAVGAADAVDRPLGALHLDPGRLVARLPVRQLVRVPVAVGPDVVRRHLPDDDGVTAVGPPDARLAEGRKAGEDQELRIFRIVSRKCCRSIFSVSCFKSLWEKWTKIFFRSGDNADRNSFVCICGHRKLGNFRCWWLWKRLVLSLYFYNTTFWRGQTFGFTRMTWILEIIWKVLWWCKQLCLVILGPFHW